MADLSELVERQRSWEVQWRWEGQSGHPRRLADSIVQMLEERSYQVELAEGEIKGEPLGSVAEFEGSAIGTAWESRGEALRRKWGYLLAGVLLTPVIIGVFMIVYAMKQRQYHVGLHWRGELYSAEAHADAPGVAAQRANVISDVRITLRSAAREGDAMVKGVEVFKTEDAEVLPNLIESSLPRLALKPGSETVPPELSGANVSDATRLAPGSAQVHELPPGDSPRT